MLLLLLVIALLIVVPFVIVAILLLLAQTWVKMRDHSKTLWLQNTSQQILETLETCRVYMQPWFSTYIYIYIQSPIWICMYINIYILYIIHNIYNICLYLYIHIPSSSLFGLLPVKSILVHSEKSVSWRSGSMSAKAGITVAGRVRVMKRGKRGFPASPKTPQGGPTNKTLQGCKSDAVNLQLIR